tara:strand:- start:1687 stop:2013 length:327 start_codon:yes stop_codon:yes gene_type:complete
MNSAESPYSTKFNDRPIQHRQNADDQIAKYANEEKEQKAPPTMPFELEKLTEVLGNTFVSLAELHRMLGNVKNNESVDDEDIKTMQDNIDKINNLIIELPKDIAKLSI